MTALTWARGKMLQRLVNCWARSLASRPGLRQGLVLTDPRLKLEDTGGEVRPGFEAVGALHIKDPVSNCLLMNVHGSVVEEKKFLSLCMADT